MEEDPLKHWFVRILIIVVPCLASAAPGEDHWTVELNGDAARALQRSVALIEHEKYQEAQLILERLALDLPANPDVFSLLGFAHRKTGDLVRSAESYERALYLKPDHLGALEYQGELFLLQGKLSRAMANLQRLEALCAPQCEERRKLEQAIRAWQTK